MAKIESVARECLEYLCKAGADNGVCVASVGTKTEFYYEILNKPGEGGNERV